MILIPLGSKPKSLMQTTILWYLYVFFLTFSLKRSYHPCIFHNKNYLQGGSVVFYATLKKTGNVVMI